MKYKFDGFNYFVRLEKGELLVETLTKFVADERMPGGWLNGIGAALWCELGFYHLDRKAYSFKRIDPAAGSLEITSLQGNIAWADDEPMLHLHGSFSDEAMQGFGGHVKELAVGGTCELFIHRLQGSTATTRTHDEAIGLKLLDL